MSERVVQWGILRPDADDLPAHLRVAGVGIDEEGARRVASSHDTYAVFREVTYGDWVAANSEPTD